MKLANVEGFVLGRVTEPAQFGAISSVSMIVSKSSVPSFSTIILNTAFSPVTTVWVSFPICPSLSPAVLASSLVILILGFVSSFATICFSQIAVVVVSSFI